MTEKPQLRLVGSSRDNPLNKKRLKTWIRLLRTTRKAEAHLREMLRIQYDTTLPRFDVMAALYRRRDGTTMSELSRLLLVSNGNATTIVDRLEADGLCQRQASSSDRRSVRVRLTPEGVEAFEAMAADHETEIARLFAAWNASDLDSLSRILKKLSTEDAS